MKSINLATIDLNLLVAFEALLEHRSVTKAAQQLQIGQPAMSASLNRLRILFADELFVRLGRQMQPTSKAQAIAPGILAALAQIRQTVTFNQSFEPNSSNHRFTIGSSDYTSFVLVPPLLEFCHQTAPSLNLQMIEFKKDCVGELLEQGVIDVALGVFPEPPRKTQWEPIFAERFVGIARQGHPDLQQGTMSLEKFTQLSHALTTLRQDTTGEIDKVLSQQNLQRRIALTTPHMLILPFAIAKSDLVVAIPQRIALCLSQVCNLTIFELPVKTEPWMVSILWSVIREQDEANRWLRQTIKTICQHIPPH
ncbi:transcriptional regulator LysR family protein [Calothrix sp. NIES-4101]|nr:transcriptional regulator LysR family protein [Calothrix sp. NIES-4101]